jgi:hypothetical protein
MKNGFIKFSCSTFYLIVLLSGINILNGLNYLKIPNLEDEKLDLDLVDNNSEINFHKNLISSVQIKTKQVLCNVLIRNFLTKMDNQKLFMSKIVNTILTNGIKLENLYDSMFQYIIEKCTSNVPSKLVLNNLTPLKILNIGVEEEEFIKNLVINYKIKEKIVNKETEEDIKQDL